MGEHGGAQAERLAQRLAAMIRLPTVAPGGGAPFDAATRGVFARFRALLEECYPAVFAAAQVEVVGQAGLLLRIPAHQAHDGVASASHPASGGLEASVEARSSDAWPHLGPMMLMAHQDVVPAPGGVEDWAAQGWSYPPFAGEVRGTGGELTVYGRGALDDKGALLVMLEAVESLLGGGWTPSRDVYLLLGCDEEVHGASALAARELLEARGVRLAFVLDEGGAVTDDAVPGLTRAMAIVGVAEKGVVDLEIRVAADPRRAGHASTPPRRTVAGALGRAVAAIEAHPHPARVDDVAVSTLATIAPFLPGPRGAVLGRADRLRQLLARVLSLVGGELAAMVRTTAVVTGFATPGAANVMPSRASAFVNMRVAPFETVAQAVGHVERVVRHAVGRGGFRVGVRVVDSHEPTAASPMDERWSVLSGAIAAAYPDAVPTPYTMLAASDSRHLAPISDAIYRFSPLWMSAGQRSAIHGVDERVSADSLVRGVSFYRALLASDCPHPGSSGGNGPGAAASE